VRVDVWGVAWEARQEVSVPRLPTVGLAAQELGKQTMPYKRRYSMPHLSQEAAQLA